MTRVCVLALAVAGCLAPAAAEAQNRASTFRAVPRRVVKSPHRRMAPRTVSGPNVTVRSGGFRGFRVSQPFFGGGGLGNVGGFGAFGGLGGAGGFYGYGFDPTLLYRLGHIPVPPYYALHPPVYYSQPIPRTYGESPYARMPGPALGYGVEVKPATIINPHFKKAPKESNEASLEKTASHARLILNPFFEPPSSLAQTD